LGEHRPEDFKDRDMIIKAAGVPLDSLFIEEARKTGYEETCKNNAKALLTPIFREISGKEINILFRN
jgi:hypothetical protein